MRTTARFPRDRRAQVIVVVFGVGLVLCIQMLPPSRGNVANAAGDPVIAAAGDIACDPLNSNYNGGDGKNGSCQELAVSNLLVNAGYAAVLPLGDNQYYCGSYDAFTASYGPSWGRVLAITHPAVGNHEYITHGDSSGATGCDSSNAGADGYFKYFGASAGQKGQGYYSYDIGAWHLIALNSNCGDAGGCGSGSAQYTWLKNDLLTHSNACTLAYWHIPLFSSGGRANSNSQSFWNLLYQYNAEIVLNGHDHIYERFAPQTPSHVLDNARGLREFIVGTGGANHTSITSVAANSQVRNSSTYGILKLTLHPSSYDWQFVPKAGSTFTDSGTTACHGSTGDSTPPTAPTNLTATAATWNQVNLAWTASTDNVGIANYTIYRNGSSVGTTTAISFSDTTTLGGTTYAYTVKATDTSGNQSAASNSATVTTPSGGPLVFVPTDDSYVRADQPDSNFGSATTLQPDNSPVQHALLKFTLSGVGSKTVTNATLRLYCVDPSAGSGGSFAPITTNKWSESTVTWNSAPAFGSPFVSLGPVSTGTWYSVDVTSLVHGDGTVSIGVTSTSGDGADYTSSEGSVGFRPQLVVTTS
jgi:acid phosphatase type 7